MSDSAVLERGYRRLLSWYPKAFRREQEEEMLAVLMAGAQRGQRRPGAAEAVNLFMSALKMRLRRRGPGVSNERLAEALALFSVVAPLFLLAADILQVAFPYRYDVPPPPLGRFFILTLGRHPEIGGLSLLHLHFFQIAVGCQVIIAVLVLSGLRRTALIAMAASVVYWLAASNWIPWIPDPLQLLTAGVYIMEAAALIASPEPRRGRHLLTRRHAIVLLLAAASFQASALWYDATSRPGWLWRTHPDALGYLVASIVLAIVAGILALAWKANRYFLLLLAVVFYPYAIQLVFAQSQNLLRLPAPGHLVLLFLPPLLFACGVVLTGAMPRRFRVMFSSGPDQSAPI